MTGSDDGKIEMACMVGSMTLTNSAKEQIASRSAKTLVDLLAIDNRVPDACGDCAIPYRI